MKRLFALTLAFLLAGCAAIAPVPPTAAPTSVPPTPAVIIATVLVPVVATQEPTQVPTQAPAPTQPPQVIIVTATPAAGVAPTQGASNPSGGASGTATATLPASAGGNLFTNLTRSGSYFNLRCLPQDITFSVSTSNTAVVEVDFYYHMEDLTTQPPTISAPKNGGKMVGDKNGNYTIDFSTIQISPDTRATAKAWFDYQFVGLNKLGDKVGSSGVISQQILYLKDCP